jgi:hypothetical protein
MEVTTIDSLLELILTGGRGGGDRLSFSEAAWAPPGLPKKQIISLLQYAAYERLKYLV